MICPLPLTIRTAWVLHTAVFLRIGLLAAGAAKVESPAPNPNRITEEVSYANEDIDDLRTDLERALSCHPAWSLSSR
jgi:hypothetical protein